MKYISLNLFILCALSSFANAQVPCSNGLASKLVNGRWRCVKPALECSEGLEEIDGTCVEKCAIHQKRDPAGVCQNICAELNQVFDGEQCVCENGFEDVSGNCVPKCGDSEERIGGHCELLKTTKDGDNEWNIYRIATVAVSTVVTAVVAKTVLLGLSSYKRITK